MYKAFIRPFLFRVESDSIHETTITWATKAARSTAMNHIVRGIYNYQSPKLQQEMWGLSFRNPVGLAAGFDKNGTLIPVLESMGFGFAEVGSITANPSTGNPKPRSFRLVRDLSLINRMGLNNDGAATITKRLKKHIRRIPVGINIAKTHNPDIVGENAISDYEKSFRLAKQVADYITINISCPNTREGKTFEHPDELDALLNRLQVKNDLAAPPILIKLSSDIDKSRLAELISVSRSHAISGYVATNTSTARDGLATLPEALDEIGPGGLSGKAIRERSTRVIRQIYELTRGESTIMGVGGIFSAEDAIEKIRAGADFIQVYTGLIYEGPALVRKINRGLVRYMNRKNLDKVYQIRKPHSDAQSLSATKLPAGNS